MRDMHNETQQYVSSEMLDTYNNILLQNKNPTNDNLAPLYYPATFAYWYVDPLKLVV